MSSIVDVPIVKMDRRRGRSEQRDELAVEEPLEIRLAWGAGARRAQRSLAVTMRTPGDDVSLAVGFLVSEGIVRSRADYVEAAHCGPAVREDGTSNVVKIALAPHVDVDWPAVERHVYTTSSCGVCGKTSLEAVRTASPHRAVPGTPRVAARILHGLPDALRAAQASFARTGGLHAAGLFEPDGTLALAREDVGRHNAVDKVVGDAVRAGTLPLADRVLLVSGRASFELVQKAVMAGVPLLAAVGAPSSLAVELAREQALTLVGFVRDDRFNVYAGAERIDEAAP